MRGLFKGQSSNWVVALLLGGISGWVPLSIFLPTASAASELAPTFSSLKVLSYGQKTTNAIRVFHYVYRNAQGVITSSSTEWNFNDSMRSETFNALGAPRLEIFGVFTGNGLSGKMVNFTKRTWSNYSEQGLAIDSINQMKTAIRAEISNKKVRVIGYPILSGIRTIEISHSSSQDGVINSTTQWINRATYLPIRSISKNGGGVVTGTFAELAPTTANLQLVEVSVPPSFVRAS